MSPSSTVDAVRALPIQRNLKTHNALFLPKALLGVVLAFPLGVVSALAGAVPVFGTILPISVLFALLCPLVVPLIAVSGVLFGSWLLAHAVVRTLIRAGKTIAAPAKANTRVACAFHMLLHAHEIAYMGLYGAFVLAKPTEPRIASQSPARPTRARLIIHNFPKPGMPAFPLTPPSSSPSYTPTRSPTLTESTDGSLPLCTPLDEPTYTSLARLSDLLDNLGDDELNIVASYVENLKKGSTGSEAA